MLQVLALRPFLPYLLGAALIAGGLFWIYNSGYSSGVEKTTLKYEKAMEKEKERIIAANQEALDEAREKEKELRKLLNERSLKIEKLLEQARSDSNADNLAIGSDSVRRLNSLTSQTPKTRSSSD